MAMFSCASEFDAQRELKINKITLGVLKGSERLHSNDSNHSIHPGRLHTTMGYKLTGKLFHLRFLGVGECFRSHRLIAVLSPSFCAHAQLQAAVQLVH